VRTPIFGLLDQPSVLVELRLPAAAAAFFRGLLGVARLADALEISQVIDMHARAIDRDDPLLRVCACFVHDVVDGMILPHAPYPLARLTQALVAALDPLTQLPPPGAVAPAGRATATVSPLT